MLYFLVQRFLGFIPPGYNVSLTPTVAEAMEAIPLDVTSIRFPAAFLGNKQVWQLIEICSSIPNRIMSVELANQAFIEKTKEQLHEAFSNFPPSVNTVVLYMNVNSTMENLFLRGLPPGQVNPYHPNETIEEFEKVLSALPEQINKVVVYHSYLDSPKKYINQLQLLPSHVHELTLRYFGSRLHPHSLQPILDGIPAHITHLRLLDYPLRRGSKVENYQLPLSLTRLSINQNMLNQCSLETLWDMGNKWAHIPIISVIENEENKEKKESERERLYTLTQLSILKSTRIGVPESYTACAELYNNKGFIMALLPLILSYCAADIDLNLLINFLNDLNPSDGDKMPLYPSTNPYRLMSAPLAQNQPPEAAAASGCCILM